MLNEYQLQRTGRAPFAFTGHLLSLDHSRILGRAADIGMKLRWHEVSVFERTSGGFVCQVSYKTDWRGELEHSTVGTFKEASSLGGALETYDPVKYVVGYPSNPVYAERQRRLLLDLRMRYESLVSRVLSHSQFAEAV